MRPDVQGSRLPAEAHTARPWRIHELAGDFELEDVWRLPTPGGPDDLPRFVEQFAAPDADGTELPAVVRALFALRWKLGALLGWDRTGSGLDERVPSLRDRLPADLLAGPRGPDIAAAPGRADTEGRPAFRSVFLTHDEWVAEIANSTVHGLLHIGWVPGDDGLGHHAQMAVLVKPNGPAGRAYMAAIKPFRHALVYPALLRSIGRRWRARSPDEPLVAAMSDETPDA
jgi:hypothetical protein